MAYPVVGITVSLDHGKVIRPGHEYVYLRRDYTQAVRAVGGDPILLMPDLAPDSVLDLCDGLVISGGDDVPPALYGETPRCAVDVESSERVEWERTLLGKFADAGKPVLGVCYGMQLINVHYGGSLHQELRAAYSNGVDHGGNGRSARHTVELASGSDLFRQLGPSATVCSRHHQSINQVASGFRVAARAEDGVIEAIEGDNLFGVEWHPESDATAVSVYSLLIELIRNGRG